MRRTKAQVQSWIRSQLGRKTGDAILKKVDGMMRKKLPGKEIEAAVSDDLSKLVSKVEREVRAIWVAM